MCELVIGVKCRMKDWSKEIYNGNESQGYIREYFEWQSKELGFYPKDGGGLLMGVYREEGSRSRRHWSPPPLMPPLPPPPGAICNGSGMITEA